MEKPINDQKPRVRKEDVLSKEDTMNHVSVITLQSEIQSKVNGESQLQNDRDFSYSKKRMKELSEKVSKISKRNFCPLDTRAGDLIREIRQKRRFQQTELASFLGISQSVVSSYESGKSKPDNETIEKVCQFFEIDPLAFYATILSRSKLRQTASLMPEALSVDFFEQLTKPVWDKAEEILAS